MFLVCVATSIALRLIERRLLLLELDGLRGFDLAMDPTLVGLALTLKV